MKKILCLFFAAIALTSCGDDDKPYVPPLNKLTQVSCSVNGASSYVVDINYDQEGNISQIAANYDGKKYTDSYVYINNTIAVTGNKIDDEGNTSTFLHTLYSLNKNIISTMTEKQINKYMNNEVYDASVCNYSYRNSFLATISQTVQWPKETGKGYEKRGPSDIASFTWQNYDNTLFAALPRQEMKLEYDAKATPSNFPIRILNYKPVTFETVSPINFLYGAISRDLPAKAYWYDLSDPSTLCAVYEFRYTFTGEYITGMTVKEVVNAVNNQTPATNTYDFSFVYNYQVNK